jgi:hypothetical protein
VDQVSSVLLGVSRDHNEDEALHDEPARALAPRESVLTLVERESVKHYIYS